MEIEKEIKRDERKREREREREREECLLRIIFSSVKNIPKILGTGS